MKKILEGIRVVDFTLWYLGPEASAFLGDLGADVYHIEQKGAGDQMRGIRFMRGISTILKNERHTQIERANRNKRGIALDAKKPSGREIMHRLVKNSDVFVTNFQTDAIMKLGLDYATLRQVNPKLIYGLGSAFGEKGPDASAQGLDLTMLARSGLMMCSGDPTATEPCFLPAGIADEMGGVMLGFGIIAALLARERYGVGQEVQCSGLGSLITLNSFALTPYLFTGKEMPRVRRDDAQLPTWNLYKCKDGAWLMLAAHRDVEWSPLCRAIGMPELENRPEFSSMEERVKNRAQLMKLLDGAFATRPLNEWLEILKRESITCGQVNKVPDLVSDPQVIENKYIDNFNHPVLGNVKAVGFPWLFSKTPAVFSRCAPEFGEHTEEVLMEVCGYSWNDIERFKEEKVI